MTNATNIAQKSANPQAPEAIPTPERFANLIDQLATQNAAPWLDAISAERQDALLHQGGSIFDLSAGRTITPCEILAEEFGISLDVAEEWLFWIYRTEIDEILPPWQPGDAPVINPKQMFKPRPEDGSSDTPLQRVSDEITKAVKHQRGIQGDKATQARRERFGLILAHAEALRFVGEVASFAAVKLPRDMRDGIPSFDHPLPPTLEAWEEIKALSNAKRAAVEHILSDEIDFALESVRPYHVGSQVVRQVIEKAREIENVPVIALDIQAGAGKTAGTIQNIITETQRSGWNYILAQPTHSLIEPALKKLLDAGVEARVWIGQDKVCQRRAALKQITDAGLSGTVLCGAIGETEGACPYAAECPFAQQFLLPEDARHEQRAASGCGSVWLTPHATLTHPRKAVFRSKGKHKDGTGTGGKPNALVIDESFVATALGDDGRVLNSVELPTNFTITGLIREIWIELAGILDAKVRRAFVETESKDRANFTYEERLTLADMQEAGLTLKDLRRAQFRAGRFLEALRKRIYKKVSQRVAGSDDALQDRIDESGESFLKFKDMTVRLQVLDEMVSMMEEGREGSWRLTVIGRRADKVARMSDVFAGLRVREVKTPHSSWNPDSAVTVLLDAHMADTRLLSAIFDREVKVAETVRLQNSQDIKTIIVRDAPTQKHKLDMRKDAKVYTGERLNEETGEVESFEYQNVPRAVRNQFAFAKLADAAVGGYGHGGCARSLFVPRKLVKDYFDNGTVSWRAPDEMEIITQGYVAGSNDYEYSALAIQSAHADPGTTVLERMAEVLTGKPVEHLERWERRPAQVQTRDGKVVDMEVAWHPDELVRALYEHLVIGAKVQFHARLRGVHRDDRPGAVFLVTDEAVPVEVDSVINWSDAFADNAGLMLAEQGVFSDYRAAHHVYKSNDLIGWDSLVTWRNGNKPAISQIIDLETGACMLPFEWWATCVDWRPGIHDSWQDDLAADDQYRASVGEQPAHVRAVLCRYRYKGSNGRQQSWFFFAHSGVAVDPAAALEKLLAGMVADDDSLLVQVGPRVSTSSGKMRLYLTGSGANAGPISGPTSDLHISDAIERGAGRHETVLACLAEFGMVPLNKTHAAAVAPRIWETRGQAKNPLSGLKPVDGEIEVAYMWNVGARASKGRAIVRADSREEAIQILMQAMPGAEILDAEMPQAAQVQETAHEDSGRPGSVEQCFAEFGLVPSNPAHATAIAPHIWADSTDAKDHVQRIKPAAGEIQLHYRWAAPGGRRRLSYAIVRAGTLEEARAKLLAAMPGAEIVRRPSDAC